MLALYSNVVMYNDNGTYKGIPGIKGADGAPGEKGDTGRGVGEGEFAPIVLIQSAEPDDPIEGLMWIENAESVTVGEVIIGVDTTLPVTRPDGTNLSAGDVYVMNGGRNNHPVVWGNVAVFPMRVWLYNGSTWSSATAEVYVNSQWYPTGCEWIVEDGKVVGYFGVGSWGTLTEKNGYLEVSIFYNSSTPTFTLMPVGSWSDGLSLASYPRKYVLEGTVRSRGQIYLGVTTNTGPSSQTSTPTSFSGYSYTGTADATLYNIASEMMSSGTGTHGIFCVKSSNSGAQISEIKNLYIVYGSDVPDVGA